MNTTSMKITPNMVGSEVWCIASGKGEIVSVNDNYVNVRDNLTQSITEYNHNGTKTFSNGMTVKMLYFSSPVITGAENPPPKPLFNIGDYMLIQPLDTEVNPNLFILDSVINSAVGNLVYTFLSFYEPSESESWTNEDFKRAEWARIYRLHGDGIELINAV